MCFRQGGRGMRATTPATRSRGAPHAPGAGRGPRAATPTNSWRCDAMYSDTDGPEAFVHEGWPIYAGPDLVYRPDGRKVVILDWKTGDASEAELQIPLYALYCRTVLGI